MKKIIKTTELQDGNGNQINRKIRFDGKNLYIVKKGMKGILAKTVQRRDFGDFVNVRVIRKVDYYI